MLFVSAEHTQSKIRFEYFQVPGAWGLENVVFYNKQPKIKSIYNSWNSNAHLALNKTKQHRIVQQMIKFRFKRSEFFKIRLIPRAANHGQCWCCFFRFLSIKCLDGTQFANLAEVFMGHLFTLNWKRTNAFHLNCPDVGQHTHPHSYALNTYHPKWKSIGIGSVLQPI